MATLTARCASEVSPRKSPSSHARRNSAPDMRIYCRAVSSNSRHASSVVKARRDWSPIAALRTLCLASVAGIVEPSSGVVRQGFYPAIKVVTNILEWMRREAESCVGHSTNALRANWTSTATCCRALLRLRGRKREAATARLRPPPQPDRAHSRGDAQVSVPA
jgi:hypothetical protein